MKKTQEDLDREMEHKDTLKWRIADSIEDAIEDRKFALSWTEIAEVIVGITSEQQARTLSEEITKILHDEKTKIGSMR